MFEKHVFVGIDPTAGKRAANIAILDSELRTIYEESLPMTEVAAQIDKYPKVICALDAPLGPNIGLLADPEIRADYGLDPKGETWMDFKVSEYLLRQHGIKLYNTPRDPEKVPSWMLAGWKLVSELRELGFVNYHPEDTRSARQLFEVHPHASYAVLLGVLPRKKDTLEGRMQRQLLLFQEQIDVADPLRMFDDITRHHMLKGDWQIEGLHTHDELDALIGAVTAYYASEKRDEISLVGDRNEGAIVVPSGRLRPKYK